MDYKLSSRAKTKGLELSTAMLRRRNMTQMMICIRNAQQVI
jgi:hypothetical protein